MNLRTKTLAVMGALSLMLLAFVWLLVRGIMLQGLADQERANAERGLDLLQLELEHAQQRLSQRAADWGAWDETYSYITQRQQSYLDTNYNDSSFTSFKLNLILLTDLQGQILFYKALDPVTHQALDLSDTDRQQLIKLAAAFDHGDPQNAAGGLLATSRGVMIAAARPVLHGNYTGPSNGSIVIGEYLSELQLADLSELAGGTVRLLPAADAAVPPGLLSGTAGRLFAQPAASTPGGARLNSYALLPDALDQAGIVLSLEQPRELMRWGAGLQRVILAGLLALLALFVLAVTLLLGRTVLTPLARFNRDVAAVSSSADLALRVRALGRDELARLGAQINAMLNQLEHAQAVLQESEERYRTLYNSTPGMLLSFDLQGRVVGVSDYWLEKTGYPLEQVLDQSWLEFLAHDSRGRAQRVIQPVLESGGKLREVPLRLVRANGEELDVLLSAFTECGENGAPLRVLGLMVDITERVWAEEQMFKRAAEIDAIVQAFPDLYFRIDSQGRFLDWLGGRKAELYMPPAQFLGKTHWDIFPLDVARSIDEALWRARTSEALVPLEYRLQMGERIQHYEARIVPMDGGQFLCVVREISERKRAALVEEVLLRITEAAPGAESLGALLSTVYAELQRLVTLNNFFVALYDPQTEVYEFPFVVDELDSDFSPQRIPHSLTDYVRQTGRALLADEERIGQLIFQGVLEQRGPPSYSWMGVPLVTAQGAIGIVAAQSYNPLYRFTNDDLELLTLASGSIAMAIERKRAADELARRDSLLQAAALAAQVLLSEEDIAAAMPQVLRALGQAADIDRVYVFENHEQAVTGEQLMSQRYEWARAGVESQLDNPQLQDLSYDMWFPGWYEHLAQGRHIACLVQDLGGPARELLEAEQIISLVLVPVEVEGEFWGFIGCDECRRSRVWTPTEVAILTTVAGSIGAAQARARAALRQQAGEERYRNFVKQSSEGIWRFELDRPIPQGLPEDELIELCYERAYLAECNDAMAQMYGYASAEELLGARIGDLMPADDPRNIEYLRYFIRSGFRIEGVESYELDRDGRERVILNNFIGMMEHGMFVRGWGTQTDITERRMAEAALKESEEYLRQVINLVPHFIFAKAEDGRFLLANQAVADAYGTTVEDLLGKQDADFTATPEEAEAFRADDLAVLASGAPQLIPEEVITDAQGQARYLQTAKIPFTFKGRRAVLGVSTDITQRRTTEDALRQSQEELQRIADGVPVLLAHFDRDYRCLFANRMYEQWFGLAPGGALGQSLQELLSPEGFHYAAHHFAAVQRGEAVTYEAPANPRGEPRTVQIAVAPHTGRGGEVLGFYVMINDITELKRAQEALRESDERYRAATEATGQLLYDYDLAGGCIHWAGAVERITGYRAEEFLRVGLEDFLALVHPDDRAAVAQQRAEALATGAPLMAQYRLRRRDGSFARLEDNASFILDEAGRPFRMLGALRDVTERHEAQAALRQSEESYRRLVELALEGIITVDAQECITFANPAFLKALGYTREELLGRSLLELCDEPSRRLVLQGTRQRQRQSTSSYEVVLEAKDGVKKAFIVAACALVDHAGRYEGSLGVLTDVTERKAAEQALANAQKLESLGVLAGGIAHDFNNLLVGIMGNAGLALRELPHNWSARRYIEDVEIASQRAADLTRQMLAYSGKGQLTVQMVDLSQVVEEISRLLEAAIPRNVALKYDLGRQLPAVEGDAVQIRQVAMNLILNAAEAVGGERGSVSVHTGVMQASREYLASNFIDEDLPEGRYIFVEVSDTGCGMDAATQERIFDPFFTTKFTGRGLGLAAVLGIVRAHHGSIRVYSEPGHGSTFKVLFPAAQASAEEPAATAPSHRDWRGAGVVLVVDDEPAVRAVAKRVLEQQGFTVHTAADGVEGLQLFQEYRDETVLVLLDMTMPRLSGEEAYREMRQLRADVCVVLSSGYNEQDATAHFSGKGLAGFLQKPYSPPELLAKVFATVGAAPRQHGEAGG